MTRYRKDQAILASLQSLKDNGPGASDVGICSNLENILLKRYMKEWSGMDTMPEELQEGFTSWPKFSGSKYYPIPDGKLGEMAAYDFCDNHWDKDTQYGRDRWELLDHLIEHFRARVETESA